jgi:hypothetical protein
MPDKTPEQLRKFAEWVEKWWQNFSKMEAGTAYECAKCAKNVEFFIQMAKDFIDHYEFGYQWEFSNDYKYFKRITKEKL